MGAKPKPTQSRSERIDQMKLVNNADPITLSTGVVLQPLPVSPLLVNAAMAKIQKPRIPSQFIEEKGREEENPMHPEYLAAKAEYEAKLGEINQRIMFLMGTKVISVPDGFPDVEDPAWLEELEYLGVEVPTDRQGRRLAWLTFKAMASLDDVNAVSTAVSRLSGVPESMVEEAASSFRGDPPR